MNFHCYINFSGNARLLSACLESIMPQIKKHSSYEFPVIVLNNTNVKLKDWLPDIQGWLEMKPPVPIVWAEAQNWIIKMAYEGNEPFAMSIHTDVTLKDGAIDELLRKYDEYKTSRWHIICANECVSLQNPIFFYSENIRYDAFLFPMYYSDNHIARLASLRGWREYMYATELVNHRRSHTIAENRVMGRKNDLAFGHHGSIYQQIWGGLPGRETNFDPNASGLCYNKEEAEWYL